MKRLKFGNTKNEVSEMCLGTMYFGSKVDKKTSYELLDYYVENNGNFIDTSNNYAFWVDGCTGDESETLLGEWIGERKNREDIFLATKVGVRPLNKSGDFEGLSKDTILRSVDDSLKRLKTDYIDLLYTHIDWRKEPLEETLEALNILMDSGKVRNIAASNIAMWRFQEAKIIAKKNNWKTYCCIQNWYSYLKPRSGADMWMHKFLNEEQKDYARNNDEVTLLAYSPLMSGSYLRDGLPDNSIPNFSDRFESRDNLERMKAIKNVVKKLGVTPNQLVLAWMMNDSPRIIPVLGVSEMSHLKENIKAADLKIDQGTIDYLNGVYAR